jgi:type I restriction enzyme S subunit
MNAERLMAHFERISEAPDAIARLRRFILDLAVRGKLVEQDPEDESAVEMLKAISLDSLQSKGRRTTAAVCSGIAIEGSLKVPGSWVWTLLGGIGDWGSGSTPPRGRADYYSGDISWFKSGELGDNKSLSDSEEKITYLALRECSFRLNKPGDILIAMYGATIGKLAILAEEAVTNQAVCACTPCWGVDTQYLYLFLLAKRDDFRLASEGGAQPNISKDKIINTPIPLPPLAEQHRIVAKVDELMALCDQLEAARQQRVQCRERLGAATLQRLNQPTADPASFRQDASFALQVLPSLTTTPAQIKQLRQTILNLAVRGKLVEQDPEDEPATHWASRFVKHETLIGVDDPPYQVPDSWLWLAVAEIFDVGGGIQKTPQRAPRQNSYPYLGVANVYRGRLDLSVVKEFELELGEIERRRLRPADLLIIEGNGSLTEIGRCAKWNGEIKDCVHQNHVIRCRPCDTAISDFLLLFLNSPSGMAVMQRLAITSSGLYSLSVGKIRKIEIPLPPLAEQHRIVAKVDELMALCDQLEQQLNQADQQRRRLLEAVLAEALVEPEQALAAMT